MLDQTGISPYDPTNILCCSFKLLQSRKIKKLRGVNKIYTLGFAPFWEIDQ